MRIQVNGELREVENESSLAGLVSILNLKPEQVAIELNKQVVRRGQWVDTLLHEGDQVEIVHFVGGGAASAAAITEPGAVAPDARANVGNELKTSGAKESV